MDDTGSQPKTTLAVDNQYADGIRVDSFLARSFPEHSRTFFQKCLAEHRVLINGRHPRRADNVCPGDTVDIYWPPQTLGQLEPEPVPLDILAEDRDVIVLNKPPGLVVHPAHGNTSGTLVHGLLFHLGDAFAAMADEEQRPGIVHRLDKDTSGAMIVAKHAAARQFLKETFKQHVVEKTYLAIVLGTFDVPGGRVETAIGRHPGNRLRMAVVERGGKHAVTLFRILGQNNGCALLEVRILTGRTHQIRVHCAHLNHPVLGDTLYGGQPRNAPYLAPRQMLHAWKLVFPHPHSKIMRQYMAPLPEDFRAALTALGLPLIGEHQAPRNPSLDEDSNPADATPRLPPDLGDDEENDEAEADDGPDGTLHQRNQNQDQEDVQDAWPDPVRRDRPNRGNDDDDDDNQ